MFCSLFRKLTRIACLWHIFLLEVYQRLHLLRNHLMDCCEDTRHCLPYKNKVLKNSENP